MTDSTSEICHTVAKLTDLEEPHDQMDISDTSQMSVDSDDLIELENMMVHAMEYIVEDNLVTDQQSTLGNPKITRAQRYINGSKRKGFHNAVNVSKV